MDRPGWNQLAADIAAGKCLERLYVAHGTAIGDERQKASTSLFDDLIRRRVNLVSVKDSLDRYRRPAGTTLWQTGLPA